MKVAVTGSSGLIGGALVSALRASGHDVVRLVRRPPRAADEVRWDPRAADAGLGDLRTLSGIDACVNLAGAGVADRRWTASYKAEVRASRVIGTRVLAEALGRMEAPPGVMICGSAIGWYGDTSGLGAGGAGESAPNGTGFLAGLVRDWEAAADPARAAGIRVVHTRSGLVMTRRGGILARILPLARYGSCPRFGSGRQVMSWISMADEIAALEFLLTAHDISGPVNLVAPHPVSNTEFAATLNAVLHRPDLPWLRIPALAIRAAVGEAAVELLTSVNVVPTVLAQASYPFRHPTLREALIAR